MGIWLASSAYRTTLTKNTPAIALRSCSATSLQPPPHSATADGGSISPFCNDAALYNRLP